MIVKTISKFTRIDNGNIEIIFTIPIDLIASTKLDVLKEMSKKMIVSGFRKGMAPIAKVEEKINPEELTERILQSILPKAFADSVKEHKFSPAIYPKFEAVKIGQGSEWEIKAISCELPQVVLPKNYKGESIKTLIETINLKIPEILITEEVNARLSQVLERIEKLGLTLEGYLKSVGKTPEILRSEYGVQAEDSICIELILNTIANEEKIDVTETEIDEFIKTTGEDINKVKKEQRDVLKRVIMRKSALEKLAKK
ncbi:MAG: trigger factor [Candidatus Woesebacteria bacterium]|nr:trigger factor [Candidatus Woesebacteria bacterium]